MAEVRSSNLLEPTYHFFLKVIKKDLEILKIFELSDHCRIVDLGCGVGFGCKMLSEINRAKILGIDISQETLTYAKEHFSGKNIRYKLADLTSFITEMSEFDYIVSRGVFEHLKGGIRLAFESNWRYRLLFDVPYNEPAGPNPHHLITGIREEHFLYMTDVELFFQVLSGIIYDTQCKPSKPNMIICVRSHPDLPKIKELDINFPLPAWIADRELFL